MNIVQVLGYNTMTGHGLCFKFSSNTMNSVRNLQLMTVHVITLHAAYLILHYGALAANVDARRQYVLMGMGYSWRTKPSTFNCSVLLPLGYILMGA